MNRLRKVRNAPAQRIGAGVEDLDRNDAAEERWVAVEVDDLELWASARQAAVLRLRFDQDLAHAPDQIAVPLGLDPLLVGVELLEPALLLRLGDVVRQPKRRRSRPRRVGEHEQPVEA